MAEEIITAETNGENPEGNIDAGIVQNEMDDVNDVEFDDTPQEQDSNPQSSSKEKSTQSKEQNSENARRRRETERQQEMKAVREKAIIDTLNGKNPYTGEPMTDSADVEEYLTMREIEKGGGDPLADFSKFQKQREREKATKLAEDEKQAEWFKQDREDFSLKYPDVNLEKLIQNEQFQLFAEGKVGNTSLSEIYEGFLKIGAEYDKKARQLASQMLANKKASPGALTSPKTPDSTYYTKEQVQKMSQEEVSKNYDAIRASMKKWKY